jgi:hypothetical protein
MLTPSHVPIGYPKGRHIRRRRHAGEPGCQDWLSASGTFGSRSSNTAATSTSILWPLQARSPTPWRVRPALTQVIAGLPLESLATLGVSWRPWFGWQWLQQRWIRGIFDPNHVLARFLPLDLVHWWPGPHDPQERFRGIAVLRKIKPPLREVLLPARVGVGRLWLRRRDVTR